VPYSYAIQASSPQGKTLTYSLVSGPSQISIGSVSNNNGSSTASLRWSTPLLGSWPITLRVSDGQTFSTQSWALAVSQGAPALTVQLSLQPGQFVAAGSQVTVVVTTSGGLLPESAHLTVDGQDLSSQLLPGSSNGVLDSSGSQTSTYIATLTASSTVGNHNLVATVSDGNQTVTQTNLYAVSDSNDSAPVASITAPQIDATLTSPTPITGTATAGDLSYYQLLLKPVDAPQSAYVQIGKGATAVTNGTLGTLDPSTLQNGIYTLALIVFNSQGQQTGAQETIEVAKNLKLGQFRISFSDISITAPGGMPIQLTRTYDTTRRTQALDFGYGWSATYQDVIIRKNMPTGQSWVVATDPLSFQACLKPVGVHKIAIALPDGTLYNFKASNATQCQTGTNPLPDVQFDAIDTSAKLTANNPPVLDAQGGNLIDENGDTWNPTSFTLTLLDKTQYTLDQNFGIQQIKDRFGNTLTFSNTGIQSSDGQGITFTRDPGTNRITQVTDLNGKSLTYGYDANGNLSAVTDRLGNTSRFTYLQGQTANPQLAHYLQSYTDGRGITVSRFNYDDSGRLTTSTDSQGHSTQIVYAPQSNQQSTKDKLGNVTTYTYDDQGNITTKVDALGNTWLYSYDANGNQTSQTDPLHHITKATYGTDLGQPGLYNQLLSSEDALHHSSSTDYDTTGSPTGITDANGNSIGFEYFGNGSININEPLGVQLKDRLDSAGNSVEVGIFGHITFYTFDDKGLILSSTDPVGVTTSFTNDSNGNPLSSQYNLHLNIGLPAATVVAVATHKTYDINNNVLTDTDALGNTTSYTYDQNDKQTSVTDPQGHVTQYRYDDNENLIQTIYPDGSSTQSSYDANGNKLSDTDAAGHVTQYVYDALNQQTQTIHPDGSVDNTLYDAAGNMFASTDTRGQGTINSNDENGNPVATTDANQNTNKYTFDANGNQLSSTTADGQTTRFQYDALNRLTQTTLPSGQTRSVAYNNDDSKQSETDENGNITSYQYDAASKLIGVTLTVPGNTAVQTTYAYDEASNKAVQTDANGHTTHWQFDVNGRMTGRTLPDGRQEQFQYDGIGNLLQHTAFDGSTLYVAYDAMGHPILKAWPDGRQSRYTYTPTGMVATVTLGTTAPTVSGFQPTGTTSYNYDSNDRMARVSYPSGQYIAYIYDNVGNLISRSTAEGSWSYGYDANHNLTAVTDTTGKTTQYTYDVNNRLQKTNYPEGTTGYREYDPNGHLLQIVWKNGNGQVLNGTVYTLLPNGQRQTLTRYDSSSMLNVSSISYTIPDPAPNAQPGTTITITAEHWNLGNPAATYTYSYDYAQRLTQEQLQDARNNTERITAWTYDNVGNRLSQTKTTQTIDGSGNPTGTASTVTTAYTYDVADRLTQIQDTDSTGNTTTTTYSWDQNGRLIQKTTPSQITQYGWRSDDRLIQVRQGSSAATLQTIATYQYDDNGNRTQRIAYVLDQNNPTGPLRPLVTTYLIDEAYTYAETLEETQSTNAGQTARTIYTWDNDNHIQSANAETGSTTGPSQFYYEQDGLGSVITLSDSMGTVSQSYRFSAFGETNDPASTDTNLYRYAGEYFDVAIGMQYNRARWLPAAQAAD
jgi:YD repeat-containing protein